MIDGPSESVHVSIIQFLQGFCEGVPPNLCCLLSSSCCLSLQFFRVYSLGKAEVKSLTVRRGPEPC